MVIIEDDGLKQFRLAFREQPLHKTGILHAPDELAMALRHIEHGQQVVFVASLHTESAHIGVVAAVGTGQLERGCHHLHVRQSVDGGHATVLQTYEIIFVDGHALITSYAGLGQVVEVGHCVLGKVMGGT